MDSLLNKTPYNEAEVDRAIFKIGALAAVAIILFFVFGFFLKLFILENATNYFIFLLAGAVGFLIIFLLQVFFIKTLWRVNLIIFLETLGLAAGFYDKISSTLLIVALVVFLILLWANYSGHRELQNALKIRFFRISKSVFPKTIMALALFSSVAYYNLSGLSEFAEEPALSGVEGTRPELVEGFFISRPSFEKIIAPTFGIINRLNILPEMDFSSSIGDLVNNMAQEQINKNPQLQLLSPAMKEQLITKSVKEIEKQISDFFGMPIKSQSTISNTVYDALLDKFSGLSENTKRALLIGVAALIFLTIEGISWPIRLAVSILAWLVYEILLVAGFANVALEGKSREMVVLK